MGEPKVNLEISSDNNADVDNREIKTKISDTYTDELVIGLCGPIGTNMHYVSEILATILNTVYDYDCHVIKLSTLIRTYAKIDDIDLSLFDKKQKLIDGGNNLRNEYGNSILAELAINEIAVKREQLKKTDNTYTSKRVCYIIDSIKNKEEQDLFHLIYRDLFYFIGVFSPLEKREKNLEDGGIRKDEIYKIINRDSGEEIDNGQKVSDTFTEADFFLRIDADSRENIENKLKRYLNLIFSADIITPTVEETAMYLASAAAGNSACLSRQVGASIIDKDGNVLSVGWNDVPKSGGGVYQYDKNDPLSKKDKRCLHIGEGFCHNDKEKMIISTMLTEELIRLGVVEKEKKEKLVEVIKKSRIKELIEFSRAVHAEMHAIITASQTAGEKVRNGRLFCTTYPCHNCARHIVAAGISEIYYIEPYRKSLATKLHSDSLSEDESATEKVRILMFEGVSPKRYLEFFKMNASSRKSDGKKIVNNARNVKPKKSISLQAIPILEKVVTKDLIIKKILEIDT